MGLTHTQKRRVQRLRALEIKDEITQKKHDKLFNQKKPKVLTWKVKQIVVEENEAKNGATDDLADDPTDDPVPVDNTADDLANDRVDDLADDTIDAESSENSRAIPHRELPDLAALAVGGLAGWCRDGLGFRAPYV